jgi:phospholipid N-methyltransferase
MPEITNGSGLREHVLLFTRFLRSPRTVGAVAPSSLAVAQAIAGILPDAGPLRVVELGPGTGALTGSIMDRLAPADRFLAIDIDPEFVNQLHSRWPKLECVLGSAEDLYRIATERRMAPVDHIISGLPFSTLPTEMTERILRSVAQTLRPGGTFTTFQYVHSLWLFTGVTFRREMTRLMGAAPARQLVMRNMPPAYVLTWTRRG